MSAAPDRQGMLRAARFALHVITVALAVVTTIRATSAGVPLLPALLAAGAFLAWYALGAVYAQGRAARWWLYALTLIWGGMLVLSAEYVWLSFPLVLLAGHLLRAGWSAVYAAVVLAAAILAPLLHDAPFTFAHIAGPLLGGGFALAVSLGYDALLRDAAERERLIDSLVRAHEETAALQDELARTQHEAGAERERTRLARDLHDTIAQELSSVSLLARSGDAERLPQIAALAPADLDDTALAGALGRMLDALAAETGIRTTLSVDERMPPLRTPVEVMFLRIAQSALANVRQHARAGAVQVTLAAAGERVRLTVADDGRGFDPQGLPEQSRSYGLVAMRSRLRELGGELEIDSIPGTGTTLRAEVTA